MDSDLLPVGAEAPRCAEFSRRHGVRPAGTGLCLDRLVLVTVPEPWPKPALGHPWLKPVSQTVAQSPVASRLFAAASGGSELTVELFERRGLGFGTRRWTIDGPDASASIASVVDAIARTPLGSIGELEPVTQPTLLVCTQGSHDDCCGTEGEAFAASIASLRPDVALRRVSHTGGHRFAPTFIALPTGRMWAFGDLALVDRIVTGSLTADDLHLRCRGWLGVRSGPAQVAEIAARSAAGRAFDAAPVVTVAGDERSWTIRVGDHDMVVDVCAAAAAVPAIACGAPGGLPAKPGKEFDFIVLEDPWN